MTKKITNRLTLSEINAQTNQLTKTKKVLLGGLYNEEIDLKFKKSKVQKLLAEYLRLLRLQDEITPDTFLHSTAIFNILIVKYFSTIEIQDILNLDDLINISNTLYDLGVLDDLFDFGDNSFSKEEIDFLTKETDKVTAKIEEQFKTLVAAAQELDASEKKDGE